MSATWIQTYTGKVFDFTSFGPTDICLEDIAYALSRQCRFNGHTERFYSVAEHSLLVSALAFEYAEDADMRPSERDACARYGLLHDAAEAYVGDIVTPLKRALPTIVREYLDDLHDRILSTILVRFEVHASADAIGIVKRADLVALATEQRDVMGLAPKDWHLPYAPSQTSTRLLPPANIVGEFLDRAAMLGIK